jgi:hypothetical protein
LIWSIGATCDRPSSVKFNAFLRQLVAGKVTAAAERSDFDLGPGLVINYPEQLLSTQLPEVCPGLSKSAWRLLSALLHKCRQDSRVTCQPCAAHCQLTKHTSKPQEELDHVLCPYV